MQAELIKSFRFEAAHRLTGTPQGHKCRGLHGHNYRVDIHVTGAVDPAAGWVIDFGRLSDWVCPLLEEMDHHYLNEIPGLENPTAEHIARHLWERLVANVPGLSAVTVWETDNARAVYRGT
jgi:6-pyruvoyltetrahydropterin/6-carboxytetrahydropterin synthase